MGAFEKAKEAKESESEPNIENVKMLPQRWLFALTISENLGG
jgi:hypothetical protein